MSGFNNQASTTVLGTQPRLQPQLALITAQVASTGITSKRILFVGDSRTTGATGLSACTPGWFAQLPNLMGPLFGSAFQPLANASPSITRGLVIPTSLADPRWTAGANWNYNNLSLQLGWAPGCSTSPAGGAIWLGNGTSTTLVFNPNGAAASLAPALNCDTFDVYYLTAVSGGGTVSGQATGGSSAGITINTGTAGVAKQTFAAAGAATTNTLTLTLSGAGIVGILGVEPRLSLSSQIILGQAGVNGASAVAWNTPPSTAGQGSTAIINLYNPDLVVWELFGDDALVTGDSIATAQSNLTSLINATVGASKSVFMTISNIGPSLFGAAALPLVEAYMSGLRALGTQLNIPVIDVDASWGGVSAFTTLPNLFSADTIHPNPQGYYVQARYIAQALAGYLGTM